MRYIVFVCNGNTARSQMAEAFFKRINKNPEYVGISAGLDPGSSVKKEAIAVMGEKGIDIRKQKPKPLTKNTSRKAEKIVTMGGIDKSPLIPPGKVIDWGLEDVSGKPITEYRKVRDEIESRVKQLIARLGKK
jgi:arsenate reductase